MISYVWEHLEIGYVQGMCDLLAPLMVILDDGEWDINVQVDDVKHLSIMFIIQAILWNPLETADSEAIATFKKQLKTHQPSHTT